MKHAPMWLQLADVPDHMRSPHIIASSDRPPTSATPSSAVAEPTKMMSTSPYCKIRVSCLGVRRRRDVALLRAGGTTRAPIPTLEWLPRLPDSRCSQSPDH